jgi:hypothetical protein
VALRSMLLSLAALLALTGQASASTSVSEAQAFQTMVRQGLAAAPQDFASIRGAVIRHSPEIVNPGGSDQDLPTYDATVTVDATYLKDCIVVNETKPDSSEHPWWMFACMIATPGHSSYARLAQIADEVSPAVPGSWIMMPNGLERTNTPVTAGALVSFNGPDNTYVVIKKGLGPGFLLEVRHGPGSFF